MEEKSKLANVKKFFAEEYLILEAVLMVICIILGILCFQENNIVKTVEQQKAELVSHYEEIQTENKDLEEKVTSCNEQIKILGKNEKQDELNNNIKNLEETVKNFTSQKQSLETEVSNLQNQKSQLENEINALEAEKQSLNNEIAKLKDNKQTTSSATTTSSSKTTITTDNTNSTIVYVTKTGDKYHRGSCSYLRQSRIQKTLSEAKSQGYTPCSICNP